MRCHTWQKAVWVGMTLVVVTAVLGLDLWRACEIKDGSESKQKWSFAEWL